MPGAGWVLERSCVNDRDASKLRQSARNAKFALAKMTGAHCAIRLPAFVDLRVPSATKKNHSLWAKLVRSIRKGMRRMRHCRAVRREAATNAASAISASVAPALRALAE